MPNEYLIDYMIIQRSGIPPVFVVEESLQEKVLREREGSWSLQGIRVLSDSHRQGLGRTLTFSSHLWVVSQDGTICVVHVGKDGTSLSKNFLLHLGLCQWQLFRPHFFPEVYKICFYWY